MISPEHGSNVAAVPTSDVALPRIVATPALEPSPFEGPWRPVSHAQERLWLAEQSGHSALRYNVCGAFRASGPLDRAALIWAFEQVCDRHEVLRGRYVFQNGSLRQRVASVAAEDRIRTAELQDPAEPIERAIARFVESEAKRPFDLANEPPIRLAIARRTDLDHVVVLAMHHIVSDAQSVQVLQREIAAFYTARVRGTPSIPPPLTVQYADYARWQRQWLDGPVAQAQLAYWQRQLQNLRPLDLPGNVTQRSGSVRVATQSFRFADGLLARVREVCRCEGATTFMALLASFQIVLARWCSTDDVAVGVPVTNRTQAQLEPLIGFFVNMLVMRADLAGDPSLETVLRHVRQATIEAFAHPDVPYDQVLNAVSRDRKGNPRPLFDVTFSLETPRPSRLTLADVELSRLPVGADVTRFAVEWSVWEEGDALCGSVLYATSAVHDAIVAGMIESYRLLLDRLVSDPAMRLSQVPLVGADAARRLASRRSTDLAADRATSLPELFDMQAARRPDSPAVADGSATVAYRELQTRADHVAAWLSARAVGPESRVALYLNRTVDLIAALLGILKAGAGYVPIDPSWPPERARYIATDSSATLILTEDGLRAGLEAIHRDVEVVTLAAVYDAPAPAWPRPTIDPRQLAYIIYTSGSTGRPKGVMVSHGEVVALLAAMQTVWPHDNTDVWSLFHSIAFDFSVWEVWGALATGGRLVIVPDATARSADATWDLLQRERVSVFNQTPSAFRHLLRGARVRAEWPGSIRTVLFGGERLDVETLAPWLAGPHQMGASFLNMYGITETTVFATYRPLTVSDVSATRAGSPIGALLPGWHGYVVDPQLGLLPDGMWGELCIGGVGVARGYWQRPALTAERYVPDPFAREPGARMYRSGDMVRWVDGELQYQGRRDLQVKIRGYRIELGEIEATLRQHPAVTEVAVIAVSAPDGDPRLVAYFAARDTLSTTALRQHLAVQLPDYMLPAVFVQLPHLPLTPSGKLDRHALPAPANDRPALDEEYQAPRTPTETLLADIWADVLHLDRVGTTDDFFELGGHSLLAVQVITRVNDALGIECPIHVVFEAPTIGALAKAVDDAVCRSTASTPFVVPQRPDPLPLSFAQERLWFLDQLWPGSVAYNVPLAASFTGDLDVEALTASLNDVIARHESLRTILPAADGVPRQVILPQLTVTLPVEDLTGRPHAEREATIARALADERRTPFVLSTGPLIRGRVLRLQPDRGLLLLTLHHVVTDGWSMGVLLREIAAHYAAHCAGTTVLAPPLPIQYADYAVWQRQWLQGPVLDEQLAYWRRQLAGPLPRLALPADHAPPAAPTFAAGVIHAEFPAATTALMRAFNHQERTTSFMSLVAALHATLARWSGQTDVPIATAVANRRWAATEPLIGFFVNTLVLRTRYDGAESFRLLARRVRTTTLEATVHQDLPFERIVEDLQPERGFSKSPLAQVLCVLQNVPTAPIALSGVQIDPIEQPRATTQFELAIILTETSDTIRATVQYASDEFTAGTMARLFESWQALLTNALRAPDVPMARLACVPPEQEHAIVARQSPLLATHGRSLPALFESQVRRRPTAAAVTDGERTLTYRALQTRADRIAAGLQARGVGPETRVALYLTRSVDLVAAVLGVLQAGAAYVPIDPTWPLERTRYIVTDSAVRLILTEDGLRAGLEAIHRDVEVVTLATVYDAPAPAWPRPTIDPRQLAYIIYTSGSTGRPKGVMVSHGEVVALLAAMQTVWPHDDTDVWSLFHSIAFDFSVWEVWGALATGGRLVIVPDATARSADATWDLLQRERVSVFNQTPSAFRNLLRTPGVRAAWPAGIRAVLFGGERLDPAIVAPAFAAPGAAGPLFLNLYGITETTVHSTYRALSHADLAPRQGSPIGQPLPGWRSYVLDDALAVLPDGVWGELCIGGAGLARGYWQRPALTAERYVPDPFAREPGARMYRSGDMARWADGELEYQGRRDLQVKIRGYRIELGEIEATLRQHPALHDVAVIADRGPDGELRLVAYYVAGETLSTSALRQHLEGHLPDYMVPALFVQLPHLPLSPSGKLDRHALPAPTTDRPLLEAPYQPPQTATERLLADIWAEVLQLDRVGITDDFFELGGHSLLAVQVITRINDALSIDCSVRALFDNSTIGSLATAIDRSNDGLTHRAPIAPFVVPPRPDPLPLSFAQERLWFLDQLWPGSVAYNVPLAASFTGDLDVEALTASLNDVIARHESLRTILPAANGIPHQVILPQLTVTLPVRDLATLPHTEQDAAIAAAMQHERSTPFLLATGPLIRGQVLRRTRDAGTLLLTLHHVVTDGWSMGVLLRELAAFYAARRAGTSVALPPLPLQYADYAVWQRQWLQGPVLDEQLAYWRHQLAGPLPRLALPRSRARRPEGSAAGRVRKVISHQTTTRLRSISVGSNVTLFTTLLSAFAVTLKFNTNQSSVVIGTDVAGRSMTAIQSMIGFFVNQLCLRLDLSGSPTFADLLQHARHVVLDAHENQDAPFDKVIRAISSRSADAIFQAKFVLQQPLPVVSLGGVQLEPVPTATTTAKFDLLLNAVDDTCLHLTLEHSENVGADIANRVAEEFIIVLEHISTDPNITVEALMNILQRARTDRAATFGRKLRSRLLKRTSQEPSHGH